MYVTPDNTLAWVMMRGRFAYRTFRAPRWRDRSRPCARSPAKNATSATSREATK